MRRTVRVVAFSDDEDEEAEGAAAALRIVDASDRGSVGCAYEDVPEPLRTVVEPHIRYKASVKQQGYKYVSPVNSYFGSRGWQVQVRDPFLRRTFGVGNAKDERVAALMGAATAMDPELLLRPLGARNWIRQMMEPWWEWRGSDLRKWIRRVQRGVAKPLPTTFKRRSRMRLVGMVPLSMWQHERHLRNLTALDALEKGPAAAYLTEARVVLTAYHRDVMDPVVYDGHLWSGAVETRLLDTVRRRPADFVSFMQLMFGYEYDAEIHVLRHSLLPDLDLSRGPTLADLHTEMPELVWHFVYFPEARRKLAEWARRHGVPSPQAEESDSSDYDVVRLDTDSDEEADE